MNMELYWRSDRVCVVFWRRCTLGRRERELLSGVTLEVPLVLNQSCDSSESHGRVCKERVCAASERKGNVVCLGGASGMP